MSHAQQPSSRRGRILFLLVPVLLLFGCSDSLDEESLTRDLVEEAGFSEEEAVCIVAELGSVSTNALIGTDPLTSSDVDEIGLIITRCMG